MAYDPARPVYLRVGDWHSSETSRNYSTGDMETGVSVYDVAPSGGIVVPPEGEWSRTDLMRRLRSDAVRHLVQGEWVGTGGEGEACLRSPVMIGIWPDDLPDGFHGAADVDASDTIVEIDQVRELDVPIARW